MFEMVASAAASFAARLLVAIVSGAASWRNEAFRVPPSSVNSAGHSAGLGGAPNDRLVRPGLFRGFTKPQNNHCHSSQKHCWDDGGATWLTKG